MYIVDDFHHHHHLPRSHEGYDHFTTFIDDKSRKVFVRGLKRKSDLHDRLADFIVAAELQTGARIKISRTDGGGEYTGERTQKLLRTHDIKHEMTTVDTPQHNGVSWLSHSFYSATISTNTSRSKYPPRRILPFSS